MIVCYNVIKTYDIFFGGIMKIAIICDVLGKANNGTSIAAMNLIRYMQNAGHDVRVVCCDKDKENSGNPSWCSCFIRNIFRIKQLVISCYIQIFSLYYYFFC